MSQNPVYKTHDLASIGVISSQTHLPNAFVYLTKENARSEVEWLFFKM